MAEYGLLWFLWWRALGSGNPAPAIVITLLYAISDEYHQTFVDGRHGSPVDVLIDAAGVTIAAGCWSRTATGRDALPLHHEVAGSGPAVLLLHAGVGDSRIWDPQFRALTGEFTVIRCDLPGFGRSPLPDEPWRSTPTRSPPSSKQERRPRRRRRPTPSAAWSRSSSPPVTPTGSSGWSCSRRASTRIPNEALAAYAAAGRGTALRERRPRRGSSA